MGLIKNHNKIAALVALVVIFGLAIIFALFINQPAKAPDKSQSNKTSQKSSKQTKEPFKQKTPTYLYAEPTKNFKKRATKKLFGTYVSPGHSPISPERFTGYHTGVDSEYGDIKSDVPVHSIAKGKVVAAQYVSGYGGAIAISSVIDGAPRIVIYGHLDPGRLPEVGTQVKQDQRIGFLGVAYSSQTDGERRHLHLAILANNVLGWRGYVQSKSQLSSWLNPIKVLNQTK